MTELAIPTQQAADVRVYQDANIARLAQWADQADAAVRISDVVVNSAMCPQAYRGKPHEAAAAILAGAEVGLSPMASLRAFDNIQGTPAPKAITLRAVVQGLGHEVVIVESTTDRAVVKGRRKGEVDWQTSVWDVERAELLPQFKSNPNYRTNRAAMLVARATSEVCRWVASDAIMGMPYSSEEISDSSGIAAAPSTRRVTAADIVGLAVEHVEQQAAPTVQATVEAIDAAEALSRIRHAADQDDLDRIKTMCQAAGLRDQAVLDAWTLRSAELAAPVVEPDEA
jgi:hypothetical protein